MSFKTTSIRTISSLNLNVRNALVAAFGGLTVSYTISSGTATAVFHVASVIRGSPGGNGGGGGTIATGGTYTVTFNSGANISGTSYGGSNGGNGGQSNNGAPAGGGAIGNATGQNTFGVVTAGGATAPNTNNISGLLAVATALGYSRFGYGGAGNDSNYKNGYFAGGGSSQAGSVGAAAVFIQYSSAGVTYNRAATASGSFTFPSPTVYVKIWAVGSGGTSASSLGGGAAGGVAYCEFNW